jgi:hypothetical protein
MVNYQRLNVSPKVIALLPGSSISPDEFGDFPQFLPTNDGIINYGRAPSVYYLLTGLSHNASQNSKPCCEGHYIQSNPVLTTSVYTTPRL